MGMGRDGRQIPQISITQAESINSGLPSAKSRKHVRLPATLLVVTPLSPTPHQGSRTVIYSQVTQSSLSSN
ncbi:hypothetical protein QN277_023857 [Acacia crassicarpa]|uniref:Uncharacterized protein n=1 Tax=Acacia crassicarpa TaxID=499986 RepID=A0AAE1MIX9_9FABA|nr:hypothetical protein QN277_023857 [Acacia crassicarpa]